MNKYKWYAMTAIFALLMGVLPMAGSVSLAQGNSRTFPETGHTVKGLFLTYWNGHGGLAQQGYPISEEMQEISDTDGKTYNMQYFERAVFEHHPENAAPFNVLLSLLGAFYYNQIYGGNAPGQHVNTDRARRFNETGHSIGGAFRQYWESHGGLAQQGYPISDEFQEVSAIDGKTYTVQYFERAVFEYHPEFANTPNAVLLSLLGVTFYNQKHGGTPQPTPPPGTAPTATAVAQPTATATVGPVGATGQVVFFNASGAGRTALIDQSGSIFFQKTFQHNTADWTHLTSIGSGNLLFYKLAAGGRIGNVTTDGTYSDVRVGIPYGGGWNQVTGIGNNQVVLFNSSTKKLVTQVIGADGNPTNLKTIDQPLAWQNVVGAGGGIVYMYMDDAADEYIHKAVVRVDGQGNLTPLFNVTERPRAGVGRGGWNITALGGNHFLRYQTTSGIYYIEEMGQDGTITTGPQQTMASSWTRFAYTPLGGANSAPGVLLAYRSDVGSAITISVDGNYNLVGLKSYSGATALQIGWAMLAATR